MATTVFEPQESRLDKYFFPGMALLMLATVFFGFARSYFLAGVFRAPLPNWLIHLHGAAFSSWIVLLIVQTSLVATNHVDVHHKLGLVGFGLASLMVILGAAAATDSLRRATSGKGPATGIDPKTFYVIPITDMVIFAVLIFFAFRARCNPPAHKRMILIATTGLMIAAVARWPVAFIGHHPIWVAELCTYGFLLLLAGYDLWSLGKLHRATMWASAFLVFVQRIRVPLGETGAWHTFATWALNLARTIHG
jgi:hypothetical protein